MKKDFSVLVVGGGPGGTATALFLNQLGLSSKIIEKAKFPRYHIGESMTGECAGCIKALGLTDKMTELQFPVKWGGRVIGPNGRSSFSVPIMFRNTEGKLEKTYGWQVTRSEFDYLLLETCKERGIEVIDASAESVHHDEEGTVSGIKVKRADGKIENLTADFYVDCSGASTFFSACNLTGKKERGKYDRQISVYSKFRNTLRSDDDTTIYYQKKFHWAWFIPLTKDTVSIGVVVPTDYFKSKKESKEDFLRRELKELNPALASQTTGIPFIDEVRTSSNFSYEIREFVGKNFLCVGDTHRFIDPIFTLGLYFAMKEGQMAAETISKVIGSNEETRTKLLSEYQKLCNRGQDVIQEMIDAFWNEPFAFTYMTHLKYKEKMIDFFAGRVYFDGPNPALSALKEINAMAAENETRI